MTEARKALIERGATAQNHSGIGAQGQPLDLDGYCAWLNRLNFTRAKGWRWFIDETPKLDGTPHRQLAREEGIGR